MKKYTFFIAVLMSCFFSNATAQTSVKITVVSIDCIKAHDHGDSEELCGKVWALNVGVYGSAKSAKQYFRKDGIIKIGDGSGSVWQTDRENLVVLRTGESRSIGNAKVITCQPNAQLIILGDLDERDYRNPDDYLASSGTVDQVLINVADLTGVQTHEMTFTSGKTIANVVVSVQKI